VTAYRDDWKLMFDNARTYDQEGSWVYIDADEMEKVFNAMFERVTAGSGFPGASPSPDGATTSYESGNKVENVIKVGMSALQSQLYKQMKKQKMIADGKDSEGCANYCNFIHMS